MTQQSVADDIDIKLLTDLTRQMYVNRMAELRRLLRGEGAPRRRVPQMEIVPSAPRVPKDAVGVSVERARFWLAHCADLSGRMADFDHQTRRGYVISCRLMGLGWDGVQRAIGAAKNSGVETAALVWAPCMSPPDPRFIGSVYVARHSADRGVRKVGFTTNVARRMKQLSRLEGESVEIVSVRPGTMLIEWALHAELGMPIKPEWYPTDAIPYWLLQSRQHEAAA